MTFFVFPDLKKRKQKRLKTSVLLSDETENEFTAVHNKGNMKATILFDNIIFMSNRIYDTVKEK